MASNLLKCYGTPETYYWMEQLNIDNVKPWKSSIFDLLAVLLAKWVSVVEFHDRALGIDKVFGQESTLVKWNYQILVLHPVAVGQKVPILDF